MALIQCNFLSEALGFQTAMNVILPQKTKKQMIDDANTQNNKYPVLYLFHGMLDNHTTWMRQTSIERYVSSLDLAVVMPEVHRSFYTDMVSGGSYWTFISEELPRLVRSFFHISDKREDNFVAGLSMGGYGALKLAMSCPEQYAAAASLSGVTDIVSRVFNGNPVRKKEFENIFGDLDKVAGSKNDLFYLAERLARHEGPKPYLYQCCGTEDSLYEGNIKFRDHCRELELDLTYEEEPGTHEWGYWDKKIQRVLEWLPLKKKQEC